MRMAARATTDCDLSVTVPRMEPKRDWADSCETAANTRTTTKPTWAVRMAGNFILDLSLFDRVGACAGSCCGRSPNYNLRKAPNEQEANRKSNLEAEARTR